MSDDVPSRYRGPKTPEEHLACEQARNRGEPTPRFLTDEYREYRAEALRFAGLDEEADEADPGSVPLDRMTPDQHFAAIRRRG